MKFKKRYVVLLIIFILFLALFFINNNSKNKILLNKKESIMTIQKSLEKEFVTKGYTIDNPKIIKDPYKASPLTALILFETKTKVSPKVTIKGKDINTTFTHNFKSSKEHYLEIYGLYPDKENEIEIEYKENDQIVKKIIKIKTDKLPSDLNLPTKIFADKTKLFNELYFFTPAVKGYSVAYDVNGDVRWYLTNKAVWDNTRLKNGHLLVGTERLIYKPYYVTGLYEIDMFGKIYKEYSLPGGYHHDYFEMPNGNLLVASNDFHNSSGTVEDIVVEIDRNTGKIIKKFDLKNVLNMKDGESENSTSYDWFHNNSVWYDKDTNSITLSGRHMDAVINIDYKTSKLNWIIGDSTNWSKEYQKYFFKPIGENFEWQWSQHAAMITPEKNVFIFDNGNNKSKIKEKYVPAEKSYSRGVLYKINKEDMTIRQVWQYGKERSSSFYSPYISDVDYLDKNHYLVHSGGIVKGDMKASNYPAGLTKGKVSLMSDTVEVLNNEVIFEIVLATNNYRVEKMSLYTNTNLSLNDFKKLGTLGKTKVNKEKIGILNSNKKLDNIVKNYDIKLFTEEDRLVFSGRFKKNNKVNVILYKNFVSKYYELRVSKHPYTALCVDIFTEKEIKDGINVTKYINKEGLKGRYSIYVEIDGIIYNTDKYINI